MGPVERPRKTKRSALRRNRVAVNSRTLISDPVRVGLKRVRSRMEDVLEDAGFPLDTWRDVTSDASSLLVNLDCGAAGVVKDVSPQLARSEMRNAQDIERYGFGAYFRGADGFASARFRRIWRGHWASAAAAAADAALRTEDRQLHLVLGCAVERYQTLLHLPETSARITRLSAQRSGATGGRAGRGKAKTPHTELI